MIEYFRDIAGGYRFRIKGGNGEIVMSSEAYTRQSDAKRGFETLRRLSAVPAEAVFNNDVIPTFMAGAVEGTPTLVPNTIWTYKDQSYRVLGVSETELIQDPQGDWRPTVRYATEPDNLLRFNRADTDFLAKFKEVGA